MNPALRRPFFLLATAGFVSGASMRVAEPLLPTLADDFGTTVQQASIVLSGFTLAYGAFQIVHGPLGDRIGKLRLVCIGMALAALAAFASAAAGSLSTLAILRFVTGMFSGAVIPLSMAWIGDKVAYENRQAVLGRFISGTLLGQGFGPLLGGLLSDAVGWHATFVVLGCAVGGVAFALLPEARRGEPSSGKPFVPPWVQYAAMLRSARARPVLATVGIEGFLFFGAFGFAGAWLHEVFGLSFTVVGLIVAGFGVGGLVYSLFVRRLVTWLGQTGLVLGGGGVLCACFVALAVTPTWIVAVPAIVLLGFGFYMLHNTLQTRATEMAPEARGAGVSFFAFCLFLGQAAGVAVFGWGVARFGYGPMFAIAGIALLALAAVFRRRLLLLSASA